MKKWGIVIWSCLFIFCITTATWGKSEPGEYTQEDNSAASVWEISLKECNMTGYFDYMLYYSGGSQMESKVSFPQDQFMTMLDVKYTLPNDDFFIKFQYGQSGQGVKGRGSDSDWATEGSNLVTDYGDFNAYGHQRLVTFDFGKILTRDEQQQVSMFIGLMQQDTANELKNVIYHRINGLDYEDQVQDDIGSTLNGKFRGVRLGIEKEQHWSKWTLTGTVGLSLLETKAYGHWANHDPAWNWVDSGYTVGWTAKLGLQYAFTRHVRAELDYYSNYAKNYFDLSVCDESITGEGLDPDGNLYPDRVILRYKQQGLYLGLKVLF